VSGPDDDPEFLWKLNRPKRPRESEDDPPAQKE
jgi:hypothetical protein